MWLGGLGSVGDSVGSGEGFVDGKPVGIGDGYSVGDCVVGRGAGNAVEGDGVGAGAGTRLGAALGSSAIVGAIVWLRMMVPLVVQNRWLATGTLTWNPSSIEDLRLKKTASVEVTVRR